MPFFLYTVGLVVCGTAMSVQCYIARWGSEEPDWLGWPGVVFGSGIPVLFYNVLGFVALAILQRHAQSRLHAFLLGGVSGVTTGGAMGLLCDRPYSLPLLLFTLGQAPLVVVVINWLLRGLFRSRHL